MDSNLTVNKAKKYSYLNAFFFKFLQRPFNKFKLNLFLLNQSYSLTTTMATTLTVLYKYRVFNKPLKFRSFLVYFNYIYLVGLFSIIFILISLILSL